MSVSIQIDFRRWTTQTTSGYGCTGPSLLCEKFKQFERALEWYRGGDGVWRCLKKGSNQRAMRQRAGGAGVLLWVGACGGIAVAASVAVGL